MVQCFSSVYPFDAGEGLRAFAERRDTRHHSTSKRREHPTARFRSMVTVFGKVSLLFFTNTFASCGDVSGQSVSSACVLPRSRFVERAGNKKAFSDKPAFSVLKMCSFHQAKSRHITKFQDNENDGAALYTFQGNMMPTYKELEMAFSRLLQGQCLIVGHHRLNICFLTLLLFLGIFD